jgi:polyphosphate kinase
MDARTLADPRYFLNRELSLLEFDRRVLEQAKDASVPLLERLRFLTICSTNFDEFFEIRVAGIKQQVAYGVVQPGPDGFGPRDVLQRISDVAHGLVDEHYRVLNQELLPALAHEGIRLLRRGAWGAKQAKWIRKYFQTEVLPVLTPMGLDPSHPFPRVLNKGLNVFVEVSGRDAFRRAASQAVLQVPRALPRVIRLPTNLASGPHDFVLLTSIIHAHVAELFPGLKVEGVYQFRVTRNSDLWVEEEEVENLLQAVKGELSSRNFGEAVRLEVAENCPEHVWRYLLNAAQLEPNDLYRVNGPVNLHRLVALHDAVDRPELKYGPFVPSIPRRLQRGADMFDALNAGDILLHHPYESFVPVLDFLKQAAADPDVLAIKMTLYRTGSDSPVRDALMEAARAGKEVTAVVELRARFDEAANIDIASELQAVGANVVYGIVGFKCHAKMILVVRREGRRIKRYVHLGTGNYHTRTTRAYTDIGLMTADKDVAEDVHLLFLQLTGLGSSPRLKRLVHSPFTLHERLIGLIDAEAAQARKGKKARITAKMNALADPQVIQALYRASQAGVSVDLIVRGICCLRPGVPGISENIRVRSIVGRFLEHARVWCFHAGGEEQVWCTSADWLPRNFFRRFETAFPIEDPRLRSRVVTETLAVYLADNVQAWQLQSDGSWKRVKPGKERPRSAQGVLLDTLV